MVEKDRADRLAAALRDNLKRRKAQARAKRSSSADGPSTSTEPTSEEEGPDRPDETAAKKPKKR